MILLVAMAYVLRRTRFGRHIYATGGNSEASRRAGISIGRIRWSAFVISGLMAGIVGVIFMARGNSASAGSVGQDFLLLCIASAVIGGTSLFGGRGSVWSALTGALILASVQTGMNLTLTSTNSTYYQYIVEGAILLGAVWLDTWSKNRSTVDRAA
jgi:D-xylose transport system permease protein